MSKSLTQIYKEIEDNRNKIIINNKEKELKIYEENLKFREHYFNTLIEPSYHIMINGGGGNRSISKYIDNYADSYFK